MIVEDRHQSKQSIEPPLDVSRLSTLGLPYTVACPPLETSWKAMHTFEQCSEQAADDADR